MTTSTWLITGVSSGVGRVAGFKSQRELVYTNTRRLGAIVSGFIISLGSFAFGYPAVFAACAGLTLATPIVVAVLERSATESGATIQAAETTGRQRQ
jgi:hypothetical protein